MKKLKIPCPGPDVLDGFPRAQHQVQCCEGALWGPGTAARVLHGMVNLERDCPRCDGTGELELPTRMEVCGRCAGLGVHDHPAFSNGISQDEFEDDPDFAEDYRRGVYDVPCERCGGANVEAVVDEEACAPDLLEAYWRHVEELSSLRRMEEAERRAGA